MPLADGSIIHDGMVQGSLEHLLHQIPSREAIGSAGDLFEVYAHHGHRNAGGILLQQYQALGGIGQLELNLLLKAGANRGVQDLDLIGGGDGADPLAMGYAVHLCEQGVDYLRDIAPQILIPPVQGNGVQLVDEDNAGSHLLCLFVEAMNLPGALTYELSDEAGGLDRQHGDARLHREGFGHHGLSRAR